MVVDTRTAMISTFHVAHMDCSAEEQLVRMRLDELGGIDRVIIDLDQRHVIVHHRLEPSAIDAALKTLGLGATHLADDDDAHVVSERADTGRERRALSLALIINAGFFVGELTAGIVSRSMGLIADALDMGADASVYALSLAAVGTTTARKKQLARSSGYLQLTLAAVGLVEVLRRLISADDLPDTTSMIAVSLLALAGNTATLVVLRRARNDEAHFQASWIFTANDIKVNALVIAAAITVAITDSAVPDLVAGGAIFVIVANGARRILQLSR